MKVVPAEHVLKEKEKDKRNTKRRYLCTDGICLHCGCIVNFCYAKRCLLCCGSEEFLVGEPGRVLRELLELNIEQLKIFCDIRGGSGCGSRSEIVLEIFRLLFPKLTKVDNRINELFIRKIIYRNRKRFWYVKDIEIAIIKVRQNRHCSIKLVDEKDMKRDGNIDD